MSDCKYSEKLKRIFLSQCESTTNVARQHWLANMLGSYFASTYRLPPQKGDCSSETDVFKIRNL